MAIITNFEILTQKSSEVASVDEAKEIITLLEKELENSARLGKPGIGLAAIQIGIPKRVAIVRISDKYQVNLVNCKIEKAYDEFIFKNEGCLSIPNFAKDTIRSNEIYVVDNLVFPHSFICTGLMAVCCAHEIDHWNGDILSTKPDLSSKPKPKPHEICFCGSSKKYRKCCMLKENNAR